MFSRILKLGIPKGSLQEYTLRVFKLAGFDIEIPEKGYFLKTDDPEIECFLLRPQEIPKYVKRNQLDLGICGEDWIKETKAEVIEVCDLEYAKKGIKRVKWVLAVAKKSKIKSIEDLKGKTISTELVNIVKDYLKKNKIKAKVEFSFGATEVKPPRFADAIVDLTETGASLRAHNLKILDIVFESSTKLITNKKSWQDKWKREKIKSLSLLLKGAVESEEMVNLMIHIPIEKFKSISKTYFRKKRISIKKIAGEKWFDISFLCKEKEIRELIPKLKKLGCQGIVEFPLNKAIL